MCLRLRLETLFKMGKRRNHGSISDCTSAPDEGSGICDKNVLFLWKYQVILNLVFRIEK